MDNRSGPAPTILFISDIHCQYELINIQTAFAESSFGHPVSEIIVLGDFGFYGPVLKKFFIRDGYRFVRPASFIEGNHEDYDDLLKLSESYSGYIRHLPRGSLQFMGGYRVLCLGGTAYMDALMTPESAEIHDQDIDRCLQYSPGDVDIIITHDCPSGIGVPNSPGFEDYGEPGFPRSSELAARYHPGLWVFGHHHRWFDRSIGETRYIGLPESWNGFGLLKSGYEWRSVSNPLGKPPGFWEKLKSMLSGKAITRRK